MFWNQKPSWFGNQLKENIKALSNGVFSSIPLIFCVFGEQHAASKAAAAEALSICLGQLNYNEIVRIDEQMRQSTSMEWNIDWRKLGIESFFVPEMTEAQRRAVLVFASFNPNGFIREQAVHRMKAYDGTLPYVLLRMNDWVAQVRSAANLVFASRMEKLADGELLDALPFVDKLKGCTRGPHREYIMRFYELLNSTEHRDELLKGLQSKNFRTRRVCIDAILGGGITNIEYITEMVKKEREPFLRARVFRWLCEQSVQLGRLPYIFLRDKFPLNRSLALRYFYHLGAEDIIEITTVLLLDKNVSVRALARDILKEKHPEFDFFSFYVDNLELHTASAILALGEIGQVCDASIIADFLGDDRLAVLRAAMISLMRLDAQKYRSAIVEKLMDTREGIVKTAQKLILAYKVVDYRRVYEVLQRTPYLYTKIKCADILFTASKWSSLEYALSLLYCDTDIIREHTLQFITNWLSCFNRSFVPVTRQQRDRILFLLDNNCGILPIATKKEVLFCLG